MYAVIETGGKQYKVSEGETISVEKIVAEQNSTIIFDKVLLVSEGADPIVGQPYVKGASVSATVLDESKDVKVTIIKFKPKTGYRRKRGHRQIYTTVKIEKINK